MMSNPAAALGQEIGKLFEAFIIERLRPPVEERSHTIEPQRMVNGTGNVYQIRRSYLELYGQTNHDT